MKYSLNSITESFMKKIKKVSAEKRENFDNPLSSIHAGADMSMNAIAFSCPQLGEYISRKFNGGKPIFYSDAVRIKLPFQMQFFKDFENECKVNYEYKFNEFQYFKNAETLIMDEYGNDINEFGKNIHLTELSFPLSWTSIPAFILKGFQTLKKIKIPVGVERIGESAFACCFNLKEINIPDKVKTIEADAFLQCSSLLSVILPDSIVSLGDRCFWKCDKLSNLRISPNIRSFGSECLAETNISEITIPEGVDSLPESFCSECGNLMSVQIPESVREIGDYCFMGCENLEHIEIPQNIELLGKNCFSQTKIRQLTIPPKVTKIPDYMCSTCYSLTTVNIPSSITEIGESAFCFTAVKNITLPPIAVMPTKIFSEDEQLEQIDIPSSVKKVSSYAFYNCTSLSKVILHSKIKFLRNSFSFDNDKPEMKFDLYIPKPLKDYYSVNKNIPFIKNVKHVIFF